MRPLVPLLLFLAATSSPAQSWHQWGANSRHESSSDAFGHTLTRIDAEMVLDPFAEQEKAESGGTLLVHYQVPLLDGNDVFVVVKSGTFTSRFTPESQIWNVRAVRRQGRQLDTRWTYATDWKPVPMGVSGAPFFEQVYHTALTADAVWAPGAGGTMHKIDRNTGALIGVPFNPFGVTVDPSIYTAGPPTVDASGNVYYTAIQFSPSGPWVSDVVNSWLVKIAPNGIVTKATFESLTPTAPARTALCTSVFPVSQLPFPPSPTAVPEKIICGAQRPGINVAPAVADDGTIYVVSRAHLIARWGFIAAVNPNLTPKWDRTLRNRFADGCNVAIPPNGTPGGCREGATTGVDPADNEPGSGQVNDNSTSSPAVTPDGRILYGSYTRYNYSQGHLMMFSSEGAYLGAYGWGWDLTPAIWRHDGTYSILLKENHYPGGAYCGGNPACGLPDRTLNTPNDPEQYLITQLNPSLQVEWKFRNTETQSCRRLPDGSLTCRPGPANGAEWCVNAIAVDRNGVVYANAEDGYLYAIRQGGIMRERLFLAEALGAAYTPLSIGQDGRIYTQNNGVLFVVSNALLQRRRAVRR